MLLFTQPIPYQSVLTHIIVLFANVINAFVFELVFLGQQVQVSVGVHLEVDFEHLFHDRFGFLPVLFAFEYLFEVCFWVGDVHDRVGEEPAHHTKQSQLQLYVSRWDLTCKLQIVVFDEIDAEIKQSRAEVVLEIDITHAFDKHIFVLGCVEYIWELLNPI